MAKKFVVVGYTTVGHNEGKPIYLLHHAGRTISDVIQSVMRTAEREGWKGPSVLDRLAWLGWTIEPIYGDERAEGGRDGNA